MPQRARSFFNSAICASRTEQQTVYGYVQPCSHPQPKVTSFQEFEYRYRQEHRMLGNVFDLPPPRNRKHDDSTPRQGPIGRAVRKLTPRKSSFVNLLMGKGWGTGREDMKMTDGSTDYNLPSTKSFGLFEGTLT
jgi:hypothetical protein